MILMAMMMVMTGLTCTPIAFHTLRCTLWRISGPSRNRPLRKPDKNHTHIQLHSWHRHDHDHESHPSHDHEECHLRKIASHEVGLVVVHALGVHRHVQAVHLRDYQKEMMIMSKEFSDHLCSNPELGVDVPGGAVGVLPLRRGHVFRAEFVASAKIIILVTSLAISH